MSEQPEIAPCDHGEAVTDKIPGRVAQRRGFPGIVGDAGSAEDRVSDFSIGCAVHATISSAQHQLPLLADDHAAAFSRSAVHGSDQRTRTLRGVRGNAGASAAERPEFPARNS